MNSKYVHVKYLAILLLAFVILILVSYEAFSAETSLGGNDVINMEAVQSIMRPVVTYESYETTCERSVYNGTQEVCSDGRTERRCRKVSGVGEECWDETERVCSSEPSYSTESYSCTEERAVTNYEYDHAVRANIEITKDLSSKNVDLNNCFFGVELTDEKENYFARCLEALVRVSVVERKEVMVGIDKKRTIKLDMRFATSEGVGALVNGALDLAFNKGVVTFTAGNLLEAKNFRLNMKLTRNRFLLKDKVVLNRDLKSSDYIVEPLANGKAKISVNLAKMTEFDSTKKHTLQVSLNTIKAVDVKGTINTPALSNELSASLIINE